MGDDVDTETIGMTAERFTRTDDETNRGEGFARPPDDNPVIPGAVDVADYRQIQLS
jgi:hypothetical protein